MAITLSYYAPNGEVVPYICKAKRLELKSIKDGVSMISQLDSPTIEVKDTSALAPFFTFN